MRIMFLVFYASKLRKPKKKTLIEKEIPLFTWKNILLICHILQIFDLHFESNLEKYEIHCINVYVLEITINLQNDIFIFLQKYMDVLPPLLVSASYIFVYSGYFAMQFWEKRNKSCCVNP